MNPAISKKLIYFVPPLVFAIVAGTFLWGLDPDRDPREIPSALIDDPVPDFSLPPIEGTGVPGFSSADLRAGEVSLVNVFASWCFPCRIEHPFLMRIAEDGIAPIYGINYKDRQSDAVNWLAEWDTGHSRPWASKRSVNPASRGAFLLRSPPKLNVCLWLQADLQSPEIDFRLYEALAVKVVLVCVA